MDLSKFEERAEQAEKKIEELYRRLEELKKRDGIQEKKTSLVENNSSARNYLEFISPQEAIEFISKHEKWWLFGSKWRAQLEGSKISVQQYQPLSTSEWKEFLEGKEINPSRLCRFDQYYAKQSNLIGTNYKIDGKSPVTPTLESKKEDSSAKSETSSKKASKKQASEEEKKKPVKTDSQTPVITDELFENYGQLPLIQSTTRDTKKMTLISDLNESLINQIVTLRTRLHNIRHKGNLCFFLLRQSVHSVQAVLVKGDSVSKQMLDWAKSIPTESIIEIVGNVLKAEKPIEAASVKGLEINVQKVFIVTRSQVPLPIQIEDCARPKPILDAQDAEIQNIEEELQKLKIELEKTPKNKDLKKQEQELEKKKSDAQKYVKVGRNARLDNRVLDLRTPTNQAIFKVQSGVCQLFREYFLKNGFQEIHTPKIIGCASEGGANVFKLKYFETWAFLAQSPQLYKQMAICSDMTRVFETGPVFRAENSNTHRHMTEFTGLDFEMAFNEHYHEVLDIIDGLFISIFEGLNKLFATEMETIQQQYPFEPLKYRQFPSLRLAFKEGVQLLREAGVEIGNYDDLSTENEKKLGAIVRQKYNTDFYILDKFPLAIRPFYTMPDPENPKYSNSYDVFIRGEEIMSGAQRVHDPNLLIERAKSLGVGIDGIKDYVDSFRYGVLPHAGGGIGMERVVMLFLGLSNIRDCTMFPRDPSRLTP